MTYSTPFGLADAMELTSSTYDEPTKTLTLDFADPQGWEVKAGKPYIVRWWDEGENAVDPVFKDVTVLTAELQDEATECITFKGTYAPISYEKGIDNPSILLMGADNKLYNPNAATSINAFRGWFQLADGLTVSSKGDVNGDGFITILDVTLLVDYILGRTNANFVVENANVNGDGEINVTDVTTLVNIILTGNNTFNVVTNLNDSTIEHGGSGNGPFRSNQFNLRGDSEEE